MTKHIGVFLFALITASGCVSTHQVDSAAAEEWAPRARDQFAGDVVRVRTIDGTSRKGRLHEIRADSVKLTDENGGLVLDESLARVTHIGQSPSSIGPILGGLGGLVVGAFAGGAIATANAEPDPDPSVLGFNVVSESISSTTVGATIGALVGGGLGAIIGGLATQVDQYEIHQSSQPR